MAKCWNAWVTRNLGFAKEYYLWTRRPERYDGKHHDWPTYNEGDAIWIPDWLAVKLIGKTLPGGAKSIRRVKA